MRHHHTPACCTAAHQTGERTLWHGHGQGETAYTTLRYLEILDLAYHTFLITVGASRHSLISYQLKKIYSKAKYFIRTGSQNYDTNEMFFCILIHVFIFCVPLPLFLGHFLLP